MLPKKLMFLEWLLLNVNGVLNVAIVVPIALHAINGLNSEPLTLLILTIRPLITGECLTTNVGLQI